MKRLIACSILLATSIASAGDSPAWIVNDSDVTSTYECTAKDRVVINGSENHLTVTGECSKLVVNGGDNEIDIEATGKIVVNGGDNKITYHRGLKGKKKPKITKLGAGNSVKKAP